MPSALSSPPPRMFRSRALRCLVPLGIVCLAMLVQLASEPLLGQRLPYSIYLVAAVVATWFADLLGGLVAVAAGALVATFFLVQERPGFEFTLNDVAGMLYFAALGAAVVWVIASWRRTERRLRESETRLQQALEASRSFAFEWHPLTDRVMRSANCSSLLGLAGDEAVHDTGRRFFQRIHPDDRERFTALLATLTPDADRYETQYRVLRPDGSVIVLEENGRAVFDASSTLTRLFGITTDVTLRVQAEEGRRRTEDRLRVATSAASLGIHDYDITSGTVEWDDRMYELFGIEKGTPIPFERFVSCVLPEDRPGFEDEMSRAITSGRYDREYRIVHGRDGSVRWVAATGHVFFENGRAVRLVGTAQDITDRKRVEETLREADRRKSEFIAVLSHELRNPLAPVRFALPVLKAQRLDGVGVHALEVMGRQVDHLTRLVDDLLDVSRIATNNIVLRRERVVLSSILDDAVEATTPALVARRHLLKRIGPTEAVWLDADAARMAQVVANLLDNSAKYSPAGGEITLEAGSDGGQATISVRDRGTGIRPDDLCAVFEMFYRVDRPGDSQGGLGIGLAVARQLVELHGGTIEARSAGLGEGTEFVVRLPVAEAPVPADLAENRAAHVAPRRLKVLVVDDNADLVEMLATVVSTLGHDVRKATDGRGGVSAALAFRPDVVLLDLGMPGMDGFEVARAIRQQPELAGIRLVALTGWGQQEDRRKTSDAGFDCHLTKLADPDTLEKLLATFQPVL